MADGLAHRDTNALSANGTTMTDTWESKRIYIGDPLQPYAQDQINRAGKDGWELVQIIGFDAWVKRKINADD